jgi:O-antigen/teichoic acid export membrane protein
LIRKLLNKINKDDNLKYIFKGGSVSFIFKLLGVLFGFLVIWIISKLFDEKYYGTYALLQVIVQLLVLVFTFGLTSILVKEINKNKEDASFHYSFLLQVLKKVFFISFLPSLVLLFGAKYISTYLFLKPNLTYGLQIMGISLVFYLMHELTLYFFIARKEFIKFGLFMFVMPNVFFIVFILFFRKQISDENQLFLFYSLSFLLCFIIEFMLVFSKAEFNGKLELNWKSIFKESNPIMLSGVVFYLLSWVSVLMLGRYVSESQIGIYNAAYKIGLSVQLFMLTINIIISPRVADLYHNQKFDELKKFIHHSTRLIAMISLPVAILVLIFNKWLMGFFGIGYLEGTMVLNIITVSTFINAISGNVDQILYMTDHQKKFFNIILISLFVNIVLNYILIPKFGINGAAISVLITTLLMNILSLIVIKRKLGYYTLW